MATHTPGPWEHYSVYVFAPGDKGANICAISEPRSSKIVGYKPLEIFSEYREEAYANVRLIVQAPRMAEAMVEAVNHCETCGSDEHNIIQGMTDGSRYCARCQTFIEILRDALGAAEIAGYRGREF